MAYTGFVIEIKELREHENASRLQIATVFNTDVVVGLDVSVGDTMVYFPSDGQLSYDFALHAGLLREDLEGNKLTGYLDPKKRNVKAIRLRGMSSDGIIIPVEVLNNFARTKLSVGNKVDTVGGKLICQKYIPANRAINGHSKAKNSTQSTKDKLRNKYPFFEEHSSTGQFAYNTDAFKKGDIVTMTLKIHGTSARTAYTKVASRQNWLQKLFKIEPKSTYEMISGSRRVTLESFDGGYYGSNKFREKYHDFFEGKLQKGEQIFYEIVGFTEDGKSIMPKVSNSKMNDKDFVKKYGETTQFNYGCDVGKSDIYVYRMNYTTDEGYVIEYPTDLIKIRCEQMGIKMVPIMERFIVESEDDVISRANEHSDGVDPIGKTHVREGVIFRIENREGFEAYKSKGTSFKILEGIIKEDAVEPDMEEAQE